MEALITADQAQLTNTAYVNGVQHFRVWRVYGLTPRNHWSYNRLPKPLLEAAIQC